ncbi:hypothetical protein BH24DEI2_BH24DEI2_15310 [soil metagenome]
MKTISVSEFEAKCLAILKEVGQTGESVTILKRGQPVARLVPHLPEQSAYPQHNLKLRGTLDIIGDIIEPPLPPEAWDAERGEL